jgi:two-component system LytT family response regulator
MTLNGRTLSGASFSRTSPGAAAPAVGGVDARASLSIAGRDDRAGSVGSAQSNGYQSATLAQGETAAPFIDRIVVRSRNRILFLDVQEVTWLEAYGNYVRFHTPQEVYTVRGTLSSFEGQLDPGRFVRIHRSVIVNREVVRELHSRRTGDFTLVTLSGERLTLSRNFRNRVPELRRLLAS